MTAVTEILSPDEVAHISGPDDDVERSLDPERAWFDATCISCSTVAHLAVPEVGANTEAVKEVVEVTLPDDSATEVELVHAVERTKLKWECGSCDTVQDAELPA